MNIYFFVFVVFFLIYINLLPFVLERWHESRRQKSMEHFKRKPLEPKDLQPGDLYWYKEKPDDFIVHTIWYEGLHPEYGDYFTFRAPSHPHKDEAGKIHLREDEVRELIAFHR